MAHPSTHTQDRSEAASPETDTVFEVLDLQDRVAWIDNRNDNPTGIGTYVDGIARHAPKVGAQVLERGGGDLFRLFGKPVGGYVSRLAWAAFSPKPGGAELVHSPNILTFHRETDILTIHDLEAIHHPEEYGIGAIVWKWLLNRVNQLQAVVVPSQHIAHRVSKSETVNPSRVEVIPHGIDHSTFYPDPDATPGAPLNDKPRPWVLLVGAYRGRKRLTRVLDYAKQDQGTLIRVGPDNHAPSLRDRFHAKADRSGWTLHDEGYVSDARLRHLYTLADALAYPSRNEGFGLPPLEAAACGTPTVTSDLPVFEETLGGLRSILPAHPTLSSAVQAAQEVSSSDLQAHAQTFTWPQSIAKHAALWAELLESRKEG